MQKILIPYTDNLEFLDLAYKQAEYANTDVAFAIVRHDDDFARYARYQKATVYVDSWFKNTGMRAEFIYVNVISELEEIRKKISSGIDLKVDASNLVAEMYVSIARAQGREVILPASISDLYLKKLPAHDLLGVVFSKDELYRSCGKYGVDQNLINEFQLLDVERIKEHGDGLTFKEIEWAHEELLDDGWKSNLKNSYTDRQREALQWVWNRKALLWPNA